MLLLQRTISILLFFAVYLLSKCWAQPGSTFTVDIQHPQKSPQFEGSDGLTIIMATFNRTHILSYLLANIVENPPKCLRSFLIVWQNVGEPLPYFLHRDVLESFARGTGIDIQIRESKVNSMNERFRPNLDWGVSIPTKAVLILDDDLLLAADTIQWGYEQFKAFGSLNAGSSHGRIIGFTGKEFSIKEAAEEHERWHYMWNIRRSYSMVLTNAAFLKTEWLETFWSEELRSARDYVDSIFNCDDILFNFMVSNLTREAPLLLVPSTPMLKVPGLDGQWNKNINAGHNDPSGHLNHFQKRTECLVHFSNWFKRFAPSLNEDPYYPLLRSTAYLGQEIRDTSREMRDQEVWNLEHHVNDYDNDDDEDLSSYEEEHIHMDSDAPEEGEEERYLDDYELSEHGSEDSSVFEDENGNEHNHSHEDEDKGDNFDEDDFADSGDDDDDWLWEKNTDEL